MPAIFINPSNDEHQQLLKKLDIQNQDLRIFVSDKLPKDFIEKLPGKKALGDIEDNSHISTASGGLIVQFTMKIRIINYGKCF